MKSFIKNYSKISAELDKLNVDAENLDAYDSDLEKIDELETLFRKYGISGPSAFAKVMVIHTDFIFEQYERAVNSDPLTKSLLGKLYEGEDSSTSLKDSMNKDDYAMLKKYYSELCKVFGEEEIAEKNSSKSAKDELKDTLKENAKEDAKNALKKGLKGLLSF